VTAADAAAASRATASTAAARPADAMDGGKEGKEREGSEKKAEAKREKGRAFRCFPSTGRSRSGHRTAGVSRRFRTVREASLSLSLAALHQATKHLFCTLLPRILLLILSPLSCFLSLNLAFGI
jgi:hypothetical protein